MDCLSYLSPFCFHASFGQSVGLLIEFVQLTETFHFTETKILTFKMYRQIAKMANCG